MKLVAFVLGFIACTTSFAQDKEIYRQEEDQEPYYFGITLGYNSTSMHPTFAPKFLQDDSILVARPGASGGVTLGFLGTLRLSDHFQFRINPQLVIGGAKYFQYTLNPNLLGRFESEYVTKTVPSTLISLPVQIKFNSDRIDNFRFYSLAGFKFDKDVAAKSADNAQEGLLQLKKTDFSLEVGVGCNFYTRGSTISPEIKFSYGLKNINQRDPNLKYSAVFDKIQSRMISFTINFE